MISNTKRSQTGITILETLLVIAVSIALLIVSINQYRVFRSDADMRVVQYNVEALFQAMANFYQANCFGTVPGSNQAVIPGRLNPAASPPVTFLINIQNDLINTGFMSPEDGIRLRNNRYVDNALGYYGYFAQFVRQPDQDRLQCVQNATRGPATGPTSDKNCAKRIKIGTIVRWQAQVSVALADKELMRAGGYLGAFRGDCLSSFSGGGIIPCGGTVGPFVSWERSPLSGISADKSPLWQTNANIAQFKQMYTTYPMTYLLHGNSPGSIPVESGGTQLFLCGG